MDRRERWAEPVEALRAALDGRQAEMWTALPGIVIQLIFIPALIVLLEQLGFLKKKQKAGEQ